jgi:predicted small lipoprotein YifL
MRNFLLISALLAAFFTFTGCGKKGNLYLPDSPASPQSTQPNQK